MKKILTLTVISWLLLGAMAFGKPLELTEVTTSNRLARQHCENGFSDAEEGCAWTEKTVTIRSVVTVYVWLAPQVQAYTCDDDGKPSRTGRFVFINNKSKTSFYYRAMIDIHFQNTAKMTVLRVTSGNVYFYEIPPMTSRTIDCSGYESRRSLTLSTEAVLVVKFCRSGTNTSSSTGASVAGPTTVEPAALDLDSLNLSQGAEAYGFINYTCGKKNIHYVSDVFRYKIGKDPDALKKKLLKSYWELIKQKTGRQDGFDALTTDKSNDCTLYFEGGRVPLNRQEAIDIRDGVVKPLERTGTRVHTVKIKQ